MHITDRARVAHESITGASRALEGADTKRGQQCQRQQTHTPREEAEAHGGCSPRRVLRR